MFCTAQPCVDQLAAQFGSVRFKWSLEQRSCGREDVPSHQPTLYEYEVVWVLEYSRLFRTALRTLRACSETVVSR